MQLVDPRAERGSEHGDVEERLEQRRADRLLLDLHEAVDLAPREREEADLGGAHEASSSTARARELLAPDQREVGVLEVRDAVVGRQLGARPLGDDLALVDEGDLVAELLGLFQVVRRQQDRRPLLVDALDVVPELEPQLDVDAGGGLVEDQQARPVHQGAGQDQPPLHPAGEGPGALVSLAP